MSVKTNIKLLALACFAVLFIGQLYAQSIYKVTAKRVAPNLYRIVEGNLLVKTSACLSLALLDPAILSQFEIKFIQENQDCMVTAIYRQIRMRPGKFRAYVVMQEIGFYQIAPNVYAQAPICLSLASGEEGILDWSGSGGTLSIGEGVFASQCMVEALYQIYRLP